MSSTDSSGPSDEGPFFFGAIRRTNTFAIFRGNSEKIAKLLRRFADFFERQKIFFAFLP
jgi:hypothetical protein